MHYYIPGTCAFYIFINDFLYKFLFKKLFTFKINYAKNCQKANQK